MLLMLVLLTGLVTPTRVARRHLHLSSVLLKTSVQTLRTYIREAAVVAESIREEQQQSHLQHQPQSRRPTSQRGTTTAARPDVEFPVSETTPSTRQHHLDTRLLDTILHRMETSIHTLASRLVLVLHSPDQPLEALLLALQLPRLNCT